MRDLLFRNLTSEDRRKRVVSTCETADNEGIRSVIRRHFICLVKEVGSDMVKEPLKDIYIHKERNSSELKGSFLCRVKGSLYVVFKEKLFLILYVHSLKIDLCTTPLVEYS